MPAIATSVCFKTDGHVQSPDFLRLLHQPRKIRLRGAVLDVDHDILLRPRGHKR
jgi:hypothetical protein